MLLGVPVMLVGDGAAASAKPPFLFASLVAATLLATARTVRVWQASNG